MDRITSNFSIGLPSAIAFTILLSASCSRQEDSLDPVPVLTFLVKDSLVCHLNSTCWNPVKSNIDISIPLPNGGGLQQSGLFSWSSSDPSIAEPNGHFVTTKKVGTCTITVVQLASAGYNAQGKQSYKLIVESELPPVPELTWTSTNAGESYMGPLDSLFNPVVSNIPAGGEIKYVSSAPAVAKVLADGKVIALTAGKTTITATQSEKEKVNLAASATWRITVDPRPVITFANGNHITCTVEDTGVCSNPWTSSIPGMVDIRINMVNEVIAFINYQGVIEPVRPGTATVVFIQNANPNVNSRGQATYDLTVLPRVPAMTFSEGITYVCSSVNGNCTNTVNNIDTNYSGNITYTSENESIATVDNLGTITAVSPGTTTITAHLAAVYNMYQATSASYSLRIINYPIPIITWENCMNCNYACFLSDPLECHFNAVTTVPGGSPLRYSIDDTSIATIDPVTGVIAKIKKGQTLLRVTQDELPGVNGFGIMKSYLTIM